jgi:chemosensory pili system protein ChpB (putative protein-glutamate methylesterase)
VVPSESAIEVDGKGCIRRTGKNWGSAHRPDIDSVLSRVATSYGPRCGTILFSGLGKDGTGACDTVSRNGGFIWVQSAESCVIANMPDAVRRSCAVEFSGSPEQLASALVGRCQYESTGIN